MKILNYIGVILIGFATACNSSTEKSHTKDSVSTQTEQVKDSTAADPREDTTMRADELAERDEYALIVPGKRIGQISLGQDMKEVFDLLGTPDDGDAAMGSAVGVWIKSSMTIYSHYRDSTMVVKAVKQISAASDTYYTAEKIATGMSLAKIKAAYPALKESATYVNLKTNDKLQVFDDLEGGIAFDIQANKCTMITVHPKGKPVNAAYLDLHPGWKRIEQ